MIKDICVSEFCIWGTGKYGKLLIKKLNEYSNIFKKNFGIELDNYFKYCVDSDKERQKELFYDKKVESPSYFFNDNINICVVAALSRSEIYKILDTNGKIRNINYFASEDFIELLKKQILNKREDILEQNSLDYLLKINGFEDKLKNIQQLFKPEKNNFDIIEKYLIFSLAIDYWHESRQKQYIFQIIQKYFDDQFIVAAFAWYYGNNIKNIADCFAGKPINSLKKENPTIGIVIYNYYGGGIEKVVSLLIPMYLQHGHKVVLITDSYEPDKEYDIPFETVRYVMNNKMESDLQLRGNELKECVDRYKIDIVCFHSGYTYLSTFYDMWILRLHNIPVIMEIHSFFLPIITEKKEVSKYYHYMYKMADRVIVLSQTDKVFWNNLGCKCVYIQNPIENVINEVVRISDEISYNITWIGRLVQLPKRVLDVVPIMKRVLEKLPCAKLNLVGLATNQRIYNELTKAIKDNSLESAIKVVGYKTDLSEIYKNSDVVLMTSESESFCNVIMESKMHGIPLVMYELPWLELLKDGRGYIAVAQRDTVAAAEALIQVLTNKCLMKKLSEEARESIKEFTSHDVYSDWRNIFNDIYSDITQEKNFSENAIIERKLLDEIYKY